jgi:hypothetical protein
MESNKQRFNGFKSIGEAIMEITGYKKVTDKKVAEPV